MFQEMLQFFLHWMQTELTGTSTAGIRKSKLGGGFGGYKWDGNGWGAGTGPEHLTSADTFQIRRCSVKGWIDFSSSTLVAGSEPGGGSYAGVGGRPEPVGGRVNTKLLMLLVVLMEMLT